MKKQSIFTTIFILILGLFGPNLLISQSIAHPHLSLKDLKGKEIPFQEIISAQEKTMVVFWNSSNKKHMDFLEMLDEQEMDNSFESDVHLVAICTDKYHNYQQIQALSASKNWDVEMYLDINESFKRMNNISDEQLRTLLYLDGIELPDSIALPDMHHRNYLITEQVDSEHSPKSSVLISSVDKNAHVTVQP